ncbi:MAG TPA: urea carboxylase-associated family protein [Steroidobacteraceae bacterium]|nr:urea carboxylase-associated family protein [Steroidobacteraceae bacterium]
MTQRHIVPAGGGAGVRLARGAQLRLIDIEGGQTGDVLWSDRSNPMLTIVADDVGRHDFLYASCTVEMYRVQYGATGYHADVRAGGRLKILPPTCRAGDSMVLRAEMDLAIAVSACPAGTCNDGPPRPLAFEVV